jgi:hypothetical protein
MGECVLRLLIDLLIVAMLAAGGYGGWWYYNHRQQEEATLSQAHDALSLLHDQTRYHQAMGRAEAAMGLDEPPLISHQWFGPTLPTNPYAHSQDSGAHPWLDIAPDDDDHPHPPDPVLVTMDQAQFWFNPRLSVFRARVPAQESRRATLELYNRVNGTTLTRLDAYEPEDPRYQARRPTLFQAEGIVAEVEPGRPSLVRPLVEPLSPDRRNAHHATRTDASPAPPRRPSLRDP